MSDLPRQPAESKLLDLADFATPDFPVDEVARALGGRLVHDNDWLADLREPTDWAAIAAIGRPEDAVSEPARPLGPPRPRPSVLPASLPPRGLNREEAAEYVGFSPGTFDKKVDDGSMPRPTIRHGNRLVWDRQVLDAHFDRLSGSAPALRAVDETWVA